MTLPRIMAILEDQKVEVTMMPNSHNALDEPLTRILGIATTAEKIMEAVGGGWNEAIEQAAHVADVQSTDSGNAQWEMAASQIAKDIRSLRRPDAAPSVPSPQPPAPAEGGTDVAGLVGRLESLLASDRSTRAHRLHAILLVEEAEAIQKAADALTAQAAELQRGWTKWIEETRTVETQAAALAAKEAEIYALKQAQDVEISAIGEAQKCIAALEAALRKIIDLQDRSFVGGESLLVRAITFARAALSGKPEEGR